MHRARFGLLASVSAALIFVPRVASATVIDFNTLSGSNGTPFTSYSENGFTVATASGPFKVGTVHGNPVPDIFAPGVDNGESGFSSLLLTAAGGNFSLNSLDLDPDSVATYTLTGTLSGVPVFNVTGTSNADNFVTITPGTDSAVVDSVTLAFHGLGASYGVDNIVVTPVPEPASISIVIVVAGGLLGRRRRSN